MRRADVAIVIVVGFAFAVLGAVSARAGCVINATGLNVTGLTANTGTYTAPTASSAGSTLITVSGTYSVNATYSNCLFSVTFQRASSPYTMSTSGSVTPLPYTVGSGVVGAFSPSGTNITNVSFSVGVLFNPSMQPTAGVNYAAGAYTDSITLVLTDLNTLVQLTTRAYTITGSVNKACLIGTVAHPSTDLITVPVSAAGVVTTTPINRSYANVTCNVPTGVSLTTQSGTIYRSGLVSVGFASRIDYTANATLGGASTSLNTSAIATVPVTVSSGAATTCCGAVSGTLSVTITPKTSGLPLMAGTYADVLTITITPQ